MTGRGIGAFKLFIILSYTLFAILNETDVRGRVRFKI